MITKATQTICKYNNEHFIHGYSIPHNTQYNIENIKAFIANYNDMQYNYNIYNI